MTRAFETMTGNAGAAGAGASRQPGRDDAVRRLIAAGLVLALLVVAWRFAKDVLAPLLVVGVVLVAGLLRDEAAAAPGEGSQHAAPPAATAPCTLAV
jgi:hypothetical protein